MSMSAFAQGRDLAGAWVVDTAKTAPHAGAAPESGGPPKVFIKQTAKEISIGMGPPDNIVTFNLDGTEAEQKMGKSKMEWKGDKFLATLINGRGGETMTLTFYREGAWLVVEEPRHEGAGVEKVYYAKAAQGK
jgi:hypothetical protein